MKFPLVTSVLLFSSLVHASGVKDFNKVLIRDVQKDIETDNVQELKTKAAPMRAPASVIESSESEFEKERVDKRNAKQTGMQKW